MNKRRLSFFSVLNIEESDPKIVESASFIEKMWSFIVCFKSLQRNLPTDRLYNPQVFFQSFRITGLSASAWIKIVPNETDPRQGPAFFTVVHSSNLQY